MLTYKLVYDPTKTSDLNTQYNFVCSDKKIHVRLRDYEKEEHISGFIKKLTYLLTYIINYGESVNASSVSEILTYYTLNNTDINVITNEIYKNIGATSFKGLKLFKNYRKEQKYLLGSIPQTACPSVTVNKVIVRKSNILQDFLSTLHLTLQEYLFDDAYEIWITKVTKDQTNYQKYERRESRRKDTSKRLCSSIALW